MAIEAIESAQAKAIQLFRTKFDTFKAEANAILNQREKFSDQNIQDLQDIASKIQACKSGAERHVAAIHQQQNNADSSQQADWLELEQTLNDLEMDINVLATRIEQLADEHRNSRKNTIATKLGKLEVAPFAGGEQPYKLWQQHFRILTGSCDDASEKMYLIDSLKGEAYS